MSLEASPREEPSLEELMRRVRPAFEKMLRRLRVAPEDAEDLIQMTMIDYLRKRPKIECPERWLPGALRNHCLMMFRGRDRRPTVTFDQAVLDLVGAAPTDPEREVLRRRLNRWVGTLSWKCRSLLRLRYYLELTNEEIAERMGYRASSIDKVTSRCIETLRRKMTAVAVRGVAS